MFYIFFFKQKTAYEMRISDWSSDVCSSDLPDGRITTPLITDMPAVGKTPTMLQQDIKLQLSQYITDPIVSVIVTSFNSTFSQQVRIVGATEKPASIDRKSVVSGKMGSVRVDRGGRRIIKKTHTKKTITPNLA